MKVFLQNMCLLSTVCEKINKPFHPNIFDILLSLETFPAPNSRFHASLVFLFNVTVITAKQPLSVLSRFCFNLGAYWFSTSVHYTAHHIVRCRLIFVK